MPSLADVILTENEAAVVQALRYQPEINVIDEYGFTPLIEAVIADHAGIASRLLAAGADVHLRDMQGGTALHWAAENNNLEIAEALLKKGADPNTYNLSGQPVGLLPFLRKQIAMRKLLEKYGANIGFIKDYVNTKMLGHLFELVGPASILTPGFELIEVSFEGFMPEVTLAMIADALSEFQNHYAARTLRRYSGTAAVIAEVLHRAASLIRFQQYRIDVSKHQQAINALLAEDPLVIPVCYEGHAITFIRHGELLVKCDRREESRLYDNIVVYRVNRAHRLTATFIQKMIYQKQSFVSVNEFLPAYLELTPVTEVRIPAQISGNCSWANVEACIPAIFYLLRSLGGPTDKTVKQQAMQFYNEWREWNRDTSLQYCIQRFKAAGPGRQAAIAETLSAILFQACNAGTARENERAERIITAIAGTPCDYVLKNYARIQGFENPGPEGRHFIQLLNRFGFATGR